jgi:1-acyl-sn-glycerol-3-phosphate acyltransferase
MDLRVSGRDHVPRHGAAVVIANHRCALDGFLLMRIISRPMYGLTHGTNFSNPLAAWYLRQIGHLPITAGRDNRPSIDCAVDCLRAGDLVLLGPEGDVNPALPLLPFKGGFLKQGLRSGAPVLPIAIVGSENVLAEPVRPTRWRDFVLHPARIDVAIMPPLRFENPGLDRDLFDRHLEETRRVISEKVEQLIRLRGGSA